MANTTESGYPLKLRMLNYANAMIRQMHEEGQWDKLGNRPNTREELLINVGVAMKTQRTSSVVADIGTRVVYSISDIHSDVSLLMYILTKLKPGQFHRNRSLPNSSVKHIIISFTPTDCRSWHFHYAKSRRGRGAVSCVRGA